MRLPRKGILIRIVIYGALLAFVLPPAIKRFFAEREAKQAVEQPDEGPNLEGLQKKTIVGPDGKQMEYFELTPEEFEARFGRPAPSEVGPAPSLDTNDSATPKTPAAGEDPAKAPDASAAPVSPEAADKAEIPATPDPVEGN